MKIKDYKFQTSTACICEPNRYERLYDGPTDRIPNLLKGYRIIRAVVNKSIDNTYMEVVAR